MSATHELKVVPPYFDAIVSGAKLFDVRRNDRAFQRGDIVHLREWHDATHGMHYCGIGECNDWSNCGHWANPRESVWCEVTYAFTGDPRFGGVQPGFVVLGLRKVAKP